MKTLLAALCLLLLMSSARADDIFVATTGSDSNTCMTPALPCRTWQHAFDLCPTSGANLARVCTVHVADGTYTEAQPSANYYRVIQLQGNCAAHQNVILVGDLWAQDHVILTVHVLLDIDHRSAPMRRLRDLIALHTSDLGGDEVLVAVSTSRLSCKRAGENANIDAGLGFIWRISA